MTRRYLHPANGRHRRNAGADEQILLYPVTIYSHSVLYAIPTPKIERTGEKAFGLPRDSNRYA